MADAGSQTDSSCRLKLIFEEFCTLIFDFTNVPGPKSLKRTEVLARWWQEERHIRDSFVGNGEIHRLPQDTPSKTEGVRPQDQSEVPLVTFLLKTTPADITIIS